MAGDGPLPSQGNKEAVSRRGAEGAEGAEIFSHTKNMKITKRM